jgi:hypothetical protein
VAAHPRPDLLADGADADVGIPAGLFAERRIFAQAGGVFIGSVLLWDSSAASSASISFLEEMRAQPRQHQDVIAAPGGTLLALMIMSIAPIDRHDSVSLLAIAFSASISGRSAWHSRRFSPISF